MMVDIHLTLYFPFSCSVKQKIHMPRAGIEPALSGPQPDVLPLYYRGDIALTERDFNPKRIAFDSQSKKIHMPRAGIEPALSGPQPDVLPLYYRGENRL
ncbi:hypothetical protein I4U23_024393 [Adineta vaga]|nr:hypothetical protein I4U23_024393 [Adineta vaga]